MKNWDKPLIVVSKCLNNCNCRYNGEACSCKTLEGLKNYVDFIEVCPEESIGLGTPRNAIRLIGDKEKKFVMDPKTLKDYTKNMTEFAEEMIIDIECLNPQGFILKSKSPSCGISDVKIYKSLEKGSASIKGRGIFGEKVCNNFSNIPVEDDGRLKNYSIRDSFYIKIFTLAKFKKVYDEKNIGKLMEFHSENKLLFMVFSQELTKKMGQIISGGKIINNGEIFNQYYGVLLLLLNKKPRFKGYINIFYKMIGYFSNEISKEEKEFFLEKINEFRVGKLPQKVLLTLIEAYALRFNIKYLLNQSIFKPYPNELMDLDDSGKGIVR